MPLSLNDLRPEIVGQFRPAAMTDDKFLYQLRRAREDRGALEGWWKGEPTTFTKHYRWLSSRIGSMVRLFVYEELGERVGIVRVDTGGWLSFDAVSDETAARMLAQVSRWPSEKLKACVDLGDEWTWRLLQVAGFEQFLSVSLVLNP